MKGDIHRFNMRYSSMPCLKRLLSYSISHLISQIALVILAQDCTPDTGLQFIGIGGLYYGHGKDVFAINPKLECKWLTSIFCPKRL